MRWKVSSEESGIKLLAFLKAKLGNGYSNRLLKRAIESNLCQINGRTERFSSTLIAQGDQIDFFFEDFSVPERYHFEKSRILYEDNDLFFYNKPSGTSSDDPDFISLLHSHNADLELLHRLDKETTGVLMFAKNPEIRDRVIASFKHYLVKKAYLAIVDGIPHRKSGVIDNYLGKIKAYQGQTIWGVVSGHQGLHAMTAWKLEKKGKNASLLHCFPKTGRTHQIRVHLSHMGHPILGDFQYGHHFRCSYHPKRCLLHAEKISLEHPVGYTLKVSAPIPEDFLEAMEQLQCGF